jgi:hypothetical protein
MWAVESHYKNTNCTILFTGHTRVRGGDLGLISQSDFETAFSDSSPRQFMDSQFHDSLILYQ